MRVLAVVVALAGAMPSTAQIQGDFQFVQIAIQPGAKTGTFTARNALGTLAFDATGGVRAKGRMGSGRGALQPVDSTGRYQAGPDSITIPDPSRPNGRILLRPNHDKTILAGASEGAKDPHDLFLAVRAPARGASPQVTGDYAGAYLSMRNGEASELATALVEFSANQAAAKTEAAVSGHVAGIDDVVRVDKGEATASVKDGGVGTMTFKAKSDVLSGDREIAVSGDGSLVLGVSPAAGVRDVLILVKRASGYSNGSLRGLYWMAEITGETPFVFSPSSLRLSSAMGSMRSEGDGRAWLNQRIRNPNGVVNATVLNSYLLSGDGTMNMGAKSRYGLKNFAVSPDGGFFVGAQTGAGNDLVLDHGLFLGIKAQAFLPPFPALSAINVGSASTLVPGPQAIAPGSLVSISAGGLSQAQAKASGPYPQELGGVRVTVDGQPAALRSVSFERIEFITPAKLNPAGAAIQVVSGGKTSATITVPVAAASPAVVTEMGNGMGTAIALAADGKPVDMNRPAAEGSTIAIAATGLGTAAPADLRVLIGGKTAETAAVEAAPNQPGVYHVKVKVPKGAGGPNPVPVALQTADSFTDLADLPVQAPK